MTFYRRTALVLGALTVVIVLLCAPVLTGSTGNTLDIHKTLVDGIDVRRKTQQSEDQWARQRDTLEARYQALEDKIASLEKRDTILVKELETRREMIREKERSIVEAERVREEIQSTLEAIVEHLSAFVTDDLPFCTGERARRVDELQAVLLRSDVSPAEKSRRVFEALQVETDYGRNFQVTAQNIEILNRSVAVDVLNIGRLSLFYRTPNGEIIGCYNRATNEWEPLSARYNSEINRAFEMASRRYPPEVVLLPLGKIEVP